MYDYRHDLIAIIKGIGDSPAELDRGRRALQAALNLIAALPADGRPAPAKPRGDHHEDRPAPRPQHTFKIKRHPQSASPALTGSQYEALTKLKGFDQELAAYASGTSNSPLGFKKLTERIKALTDQLTEADRQALAPRLKQVDAALERAKRAMAPAPKQEEAAEPTPRRVTKPAAKPAPKPVAASVKPAEPAKPRAPFSSQRGQYVVERELTGAKLLTESGLEAGRISEAVVRKFNLSSGTIVKADIRPTEVFVHKALRQIDHLGDQKFDDAATISTFNFGVVKKHKRHLRVTFNSNDEPLLVNGKKYAFLLPEDNLAVGNGAIVELAWYTKDPDTMRIRWTYPTEEETSDRPAPAAKKAKPKTSKPAAKRYPGIDLAGQTVAVLVGDRQQHAAYEEMVARYGGTAVIVDGFKTQKSYLKNKLRSANLVILIKDHAHHGASKAVTDFQNQFGFNFAVANTLAMGQFEDALYRAANGFPADTASLSEHPVLTK